MLCIAFTNQTNGEANAIGSLPMRQAHRRPSTQLVRSHQIGPIYKARAARAKAATEPRVAPILPAAPVKGGGVVGEVEFPDGVGTAEALVDDESQTVM